MGNGHNLFELEPRKNNSDVDALFFLKDARFQRERALIRLQSYTVKCTTPGHLTYSSPKSNIIAFMQSLIYLLLHI